jgi:hypothetical protein
MGLEALIAGCNGWILTLEVITGNGISIEETYTFLEWCLLRYPIERFSQFASCCVSI